MIKRLEDGEYTLEALAGGLEREEEEQQRSAAGCWLAVDRDFGDQEYFSTEQEALDQAEEWIQHYRDNAPDAGWPADMGIEVYQQRYQARSHPVESTDGCDEEWVDFSMCPVETKKD